MLQSKYRVKARNRVHFVTTIVIIVLVGEVCFASGGDFEYWATAGAFLDINKDWGCTFEEELRFKDTGGELYYHHSDLGFVYKSIADWIDVGVNFRKVYSKDSKGEWTQEDRPHLNATLKGKVFGLDVSDRSRLEYRDRESEKDVWRYRNKVVVKLPVELAPLKLQPYVEEEVFINLDKEGFDLNRLSGGFSVNLSKKVKGDIYYLWQASELDGGWKDVNVIGASLKFYF
jgi:hypothetical protein